MIRIFPWSAAMRPPSTPVPDVGVPLICNPLPATFGLAPQANPAVYATQWCTPRIYRDTIAVGVERWRTLQQFRNLHPHTGTYQFHNTPSRVSGLPAEGLPRRNTVLQNAYEHTANEVTINNVLASRGMTLSRTT
jgi:hypothetical protein